MKDPAEDIETRALTRLATRAAASLARVAPSVIPVFLPTARGRRKFLGSAVLLRVGPAEFMVTAAHVMDDAKSDFHVLIGSAVVPINARYTTTEAPNGDRRADRFDLCVVRLSHEHVREMRRCHFLSLDELEPDETPNLRPTIGGKYLLVGFPANWQTVHHDGTIEYEHSRITANALPLDSYKRGGWSTDSHLIIEYDKKRSWNVAGRTTPPDPDGVSGGGIFRARGWIAREPQSERLIAIPIRYTGKLGKSVVATRISYVLTHIANEYTELRGYIASSKQRAPAI